MITPEEIAEARAALEASSPAPWIADLDCFDDDERSIEACVSGGGEGPPMLFMSPTELHNQATVTGTREDQWALAKETQDYKDAVLIALSRSLLPRLLDEIERLSPGGADPVCGANCGEDFPDVPRPPGRAAKPCMPCVVHGFCHMCEVEQMQHQVKLARDDAADLRGRINRARVALDPFAEEPPSSPVGTILRATEEAIVALGLSPEVKEILVAIRREVFAAGQDDMRTKAVAILREMGRMADGAEPLAKEDVSELAAEFFRGRGTAFRSSEAAVLGLRLESDG